MRPAPAHNELPCVWVSAGVLSYRLCDREYDCEACPLYQALRGGSPVADSEAGSPVPGAGPTGEDPVGRYLVELGAGCKLHLDRAYSPEGLWVACEPSGSLRFGLDDYTLRLLHPVQQVVLPRPGLWLRQNAPCAWVDRGRLSLALRCPVAGEVLEVHPSPFRTPPREREDAHDRWWFRAAPVESVALAPGLYRNEALLNWFLSRVRTVHEHLGAVMAAPAAGRAGATLSDGGIPTRDLEMVLGRDRYEVLIGTLFPVNV